MAESVSTAKASAEQPSDHACPNCGSLWSEQDLARTGYRCGECGLELVHTVHATGSAPDPLSWLHHPGDVVLDRYRIEKLLGKGGFAVAYLVEDLRINGRKRALKEIPESRYDEAEMEVLSRLSHPAIPDIIDRIHHGGMVYLVLEFGGGRTLEDERRHQDGRIPFTVLRPWLQQLGNALGYLHGQNPPIIHRDLKSDNILLDDRDRIMLIDFGIAKQAVAGGETRTLARAATNGYSPPEQALGTGTDPRSDVYALAATAYTLLTGQVPPSAYERVAGQELTPPSHLVRGLPPQFDAAIVQALSLNMNLRPATVAQFLRPMDAVAAASPTVRAEDLTPKPEKPGTSKYDGQRRAAAAATTSPPGRARWILWTAVAAVVVLMAGSAHFLISGPDPPEVFTAAPVLSPQAEVVSTTAKPVTPVATEVTQLAAEQPAAAPELESRDPKPANTTEGSALQQLSIKRQSPSSRAVPRESPKEKYNYLDATPPSAMQPNQSRVPVSPMAPKKSIPDWGFQ